MWSKSVPFIVYGVLVMFFTSKLPVFVVNDGLNVFLKYAVYLALPDQKSFQRPKNNALINTPGFPSGHAQLCTLIFVETAKECGFVSEESFLAASLLVSVCMDRLFMECHNKLQLLGGISCGLMFEFGRSYTRFVS